MKAGPKRPLYARYAMNQTPRAGAVKPPARGSFPLDHHGVCKARMREFLACLRTHGDAHAACRDLSKRYLQCRMESNLMAPEDLESMGFSGEAAVGAKPAPERSGEVIAGLGTVKAAKQGVFLGLGTGGVAVSAKGGHG